MVTIFFAARIEGIAEVEVVLYRMELSFKVWLQFLAPVVEAKSDKVY